MTAKRKFSSVEELVRQTTDKEFADRFERESLERELVNTLFGLRTAKGLSQSDIAEKLGCSQSRISKLEAGRDAEISLGDLDKYLEAVGFDLTIAIRPKETTAMSLVKYHAHGIRRQLERMRELAGNDKSMLDGVFGSYLETLFNLMKIVVGSMKKLPHSDELEAAPLVRFEGEEEDANSDCAVA